MASGLQHRSFRLPLQAAGSTAPNGSDPTAHINARVSFSLPLPYFLLAFIVVNGVAVLAITSSI